VAVVGDGHGQLLAYSLATAADTALAAAASENADSPVHDYVVAPLWTCDLTTLRPAAPPAPAAAGEKAGTSVKAPPPLTAATAAASIRLRQSLSQDLLAQVGDDPRHHHCHRD